MEYENNMIDGEFTFDNELPTALEAIEQLGKLLQVYNYRTEVIPSTAKLQLIHTLTEQGLVIQLATAPNGELSISSINTLGDTLPSEHFNLLVNLVVEALWRYKQL
jgi:hypothetical protein